MKKDKKDIADSSAPLAVNALLCACTVDEIQEKINFYEKHLEHLIKNSNKVSSDFYYSEKEDIEVIIKSLKSKLCNN